MSRDDSGQGRGLPPSKTPERKQLSPELQRLVDKTDRDENFYDELYEGRAPQSTESNIRYAAYASRIRTALLSAQRYIAYTSDIGESFRPVAHPNLVRSAYGISWAYLIGDVAHEGYKAYCSNQRILHPELPREATKQHYNDAKADLQSAPVVQELVPAHGTVSRLEDYRTVMAQRAIFQGLASMGLPALTIHSIVRYSSAAMKSVKNVRVRTYGPIGLGLAAVPALPFLFDEPVEKGVEWVFHKGFEAFGGPSAVGDTPRTGREAQLARQGKSPPKEKEL